MGSKNRRLNPSTVWKILFAIFMIISSLIILIYIAKMRPELINGSGDPSQPIETPVLDHLLERITDVASEISDAASGLTDAASEFLHRDATIAPAATELKQRIASTLTWMTAKDSPPFLRWDLVANADVHILNRLAIFLKQWSNGMISNAQLDSLAKKGLQCTPLQAAQQELISKFISMDICSEVEWYKLVQVAAPEMKTFLDVGANKGYLGSLFLALWGGGKIGVNPAKILELSKSLQTWPGSRNPGGYCRDGFNSAIQSYCPATASRDTTTGRCNILQDVKVYSFDGSRYLAETLTGMMRDHLSKNSPAFRSEQTSPWIYSNYAVANQVGVTRFTKQNRTERAGFEGGSIQRGGGTGGPRAGRKPSAPMETEEVPMISIDHFVRQHNLSHIDILKIDTEGHDNNVLLGAREVLENRVSMFTFEGGKGVTLSRAMLGEFDSWGFNCYSTSRAGLFKWNGGCMKEQYMGGFRAKDKGNIFCVSRRHVPLVALAYDALSFPAMIDTLMRDPQAYGVEGVALSQLQEALGLGQGKEQQGTEITLPKKIDISSLLPLYINIHPFCKPFPQCAAVALSAKA